MNRRIAAPRGRNVFRTTQKAIERIGVPSVRRCAIVALGIFEAAEFDRFATDVIDMIKEGVMIGPAMLKAAEIGRKYTNRQIHW